MSLQTNTKNKSMSWLNFWAKIAITLPSYLWKWKIQVMICTGQKKHVNINMRQTLSAFFHPDFKNDDMMSLRHIWKYDPL